MSQISVNRLTFCYDGSSDNVFDNVSFALDTDWKLGFIGRNGKGKTTLLRLMTGGYSFTGSIDKSVRCEYFPYDITEDMMSQCASQFISDIKPDCEEWRVICELSVLGEDADVLYRPFGTLSPGERTKVLLAVLFSGDNEFLLIDEPTNHLDSGARETVKGYLTDKKGFILVSHDRDLLDACTDHVLVLNRRTIEVQSGNFSSWWENKQKKDSFAQAENEKHKKEIKKLRQTARRISEWAERSESTKIGFDPVKEHDRCLSTRSYIGAKTKKMQKRVILTERRIEQEIEEKEGLMQDVENIRDLKLTPLKHHKRTVVNVRDLTAGYGTPLFTGLGFTVDTGERVALTGSNGCGKSTLIKLILQSAGYGHTDAEMSGTCETASGLIISHISQDTSHLSGSIEKHCADRGLDRSMLCSLLRHMGLERTQFEKDIADFSEGQKKKVLIASSLITPAHLYIWDEPLNFIDIFSRMQIEKLILDYSPTMIFVEHDTMFCDRIATKKTDISSAQKGACV
ncbi:MAG: ABC-F family ATP-binding cassette domain-containing protein [Oscillospiraceae bacterium]|nr:ABC-F family ATP-binding cassette domain-containing protein [Oscillospiraceae bacterium]